MYGSQHQGRQRRHMPLPSMRIVRLTLQLRYYASNMCLHVELDIAGPRKGRPVRNVLQFLWGSFRRSATTNLPSGLHSTYYGTVFLFTVALVGYAVVWGTAEGGKKANETQEIIAYTVLDIVTKTLVLLIPIVNSNSYITYGSALAWAGNVKFDM
jgi:hypothetical protein